jgi:hypothetical protein
MEKDNMQKQYEEITEIIINNFPNDYIESLISLSEISRQQFQGNDDNILSINTEGAFYGN